MLKLGYLNFDNRRNARPRIQSVHNDLFPIYRIRLRGLAFHMSRVLCDLPNETTFCLLKLDKLPILSPADCEASQSILRNTVQHSKKGSLTYNMCR